MPTLSRENKRRITRAVTTTVVGGSAYLLYKYWYAPPPKDEGRGEDQIDIAEDPLHGGVQSLDRSCKAWESALSEATRKGDVETANNLRQVLRRAYACLDAYNSSFSRPDYSSSSSSRRIASSTDDMLNDVEIASFQSARDDHDQDLAGFNELVQSTPARAGSGNSHLDSPLFTTDVSAINPSVTAGGPSAGLVGGPGDSSIGAVASNGGGDDLWKRAMSLAADGKIKVRKVRLEYTGCKNETDYAAHVYCFREALRVIGLSEVKRNVIREPFMRIVTGMLIRGNNDPAEFVAAVEKMERYVAKQMSLDACVSMMKELSVKGVKEYNLYDIVLDFMLFDSFDDLKCPPQAVTDALQSRWVPSAVRVRGLRAAVWAVTRSRRSMMPEGSFMQHFYDIAIALAPTLAGGMLSLGDQEFVDLCKGFKAMILEYIGACFAIAHTEANLTAESYSEKILEKTRLYTPRAIQMVHKAMKK
jgi:hypothetical protein